VQVRPVGVLLLRDDGERDEKILAVPTSGPLSDVGDLATLESGYPGITLIIETWFTNYKGAGRVTSAGLDDAAAAMALVLEANRHCEANAR
jgi:inorganic pyrophosphatase